MVKKCSYCKCNIPKGTECFDLDIFNKQGVLTTIHFCSKEHSSLYEAEELINSMITRLTGTKTVPKAIKDVIKDFDVISFNKYLSENIDYYKDIMSKKYFKTARARNNYILAIFRNNYKNEKTDYSEIIDNSECYIEDYPKGKQVEDKITIFDIDI